MYNEGVGRQSAGVKGAEKGENSIVKEKEKERDRERGGEGSICF